jgi:hypothetical protein
MLAEPFLGAEAVARNDISQRWQRPGAGHIKL